MSIKQQASVTLTDENFHAEVLENSTPVLVDFWAPWFGPCRMMGPIIEDLAGEFFNRAKVGKLNVDDASKLAAQYGIQSIPTLMFFQNGQPIDQVVGVVSKNIIANKMENFLSPA